MPETATLYGGPQDGILVHCVGGLPPTIYVGSKWLGDGYAVWSREPSEKN